MGWGLIGSGMCSFRDSVLDRRTGYAMSWMAVKMHTLGWFSSCLFSVSAFVSPSPREWLRAGVWITRIALISMLAWTLDS